MDSAPLQVHENWRAPPVPAGQRCCAIDVTRLPCAAFWKPAERRHTLDSELCQVGEYPHHVELDRQGLWRMQLARSCMPASSLDVVSHPVCKRALKVRSNVSLLVHGMGIYLHNMASGTLAVRSAAKQEHNVPIRSARTHAVWYA